MFVSVPIHSIETRRREDERLVEAELHEELVALFLLLAHRSRGEGFAVKLVELGAWGAGFGVGVSAGCFFADRHAGHE